jgi:CBS-domain-containing membrane protein
MSRKSSSLSRFIERWSLLDSKFRQNKLRYVFQTGLAAITMMAVLLLLDEVAQTVLIASLGASAFIAFAMPRSYPSRPRYMIGGYCVGTAVGCLLSVAASVLAEQLGVPPRAVQIICGAVATGLAFFVMVVTDTEHPPAAALALGYVLNEWQMGTILVVLGGVTALALIKELFRSRLMDLV